MVVDSVAAGAVDTSRQAAVQDAGEARVGAHLEVLAEGPRVATHLFECTDPAYKGWRWSVTPRCCCWTNPMPVWDPEAPWS